MMLPRATLESDRSIVSGARLGRGQANATGLVPNTGCEPPHGAMAEGRVDEQDGDKAGLGKALHRMAGGAAMVRARIAAAATPWLRAMSGSAVSASSIAG